jgi:hypothetical protein
MNEGICAANDCTPFAQGTDCFRFLFGCLVFPITEQKADESADLEAGDIIVILA